MAAADRTASVDRVISGMSRVVSDVLRLRRGNLLSALVEGMSGGVSKRDFLGSIDELRPRVYEALADAYGDGYYAKLIYLKLTNFLISKYHHDSRHLKMVSKPVTLMHDPSNACQLRCPGCVHSSNKDFTKDFDWPAALMKATTFRDVLGEIGPYALNTNLYNYGEPLLNKDIAEFVAAASGYAMTSFFSSNLSMEFDVDRLVKAGPDHMILSIDGVSQDTYAKFRRRGELSLVLDNVRKLVEAKNKYGFNRPFLAWRFLTFEHNVHEVDDAIELAREIGVDSILIATPFDVSIDEPGVQVAKSDREGEHVFTRPEGRRPERILELLVRDERVEELFDEDWLARADEGDLDEPASSSPSTCSWLYYNMTIDSMGRIMPCCIVPSATQHLVFGQLSEGGAAWNTDLFVSSRLCFANPAEFMKTTRASAEPVSFCDACPSIPPLSYGPENGIQDLHELDFHGACLAPFESARWWELARWK